MFPRRVAAVFIVVALCFSLGLPAWGQYDPSPEAQNDLRLRREYLISYPGLFAFRYDPEEVTNFIPPMYWNYAHTSKGYNLSLEPEEEIIEEEVPLAAPELPKTGGFAPELLYALGASLIATGLKIRKK